MKQSQMSLIRHSFGTAAGLMATRKIILLPFFIVAAVEAASVVGLFFLIQDPLVRFVQPIILRYRDPVFLHYPLCLLLLSQIFSWLQGGLAVVLGTFMSGVVIHTSWQAMTREKLSLGEALRMSVKRYVALLFISVCVYAFAHGTFAVEHTMLKGVLKSGSSFLGLGREVWRVIFLMTGIAGAGLAQTIFAFTQTILMIETPNLAAALARSLKYALRNFPAVIITLLAPLGAYLPVSMLKGGMQGLFERFSPEIVFVVIGIGIVVGFFINVFITIATTALYVRIKANERA